MPDQYEAGGSDPRSRARLRTVAAAKQARRSNITSDGRCVVVTVTAGKKPDAQLWVRDS
ncbi:hypothetical protein ACWCRD_33660 [Streptomyces sp. NPDC002092]